jgi:hypothetical protein
MREGNLGWNGVEVEAGRLLLVAFEDVPASADAAPLSPVAVSSLQSPEDSLVKSVERAIAIEETADPEARAQLIGEGMDSYLEFLSDYSHYAAGRLKRIPRPKAVELELALLEDDSRSSAHRLAAESNLQMELWKAGDPNDTLNKRIIGAFFRTLSAQDEQLRRQTFLGIYSLMFPQNTEKQPAGEEFRIRLLTGAQLPPKKSILDALRELEKNEDISKEVLWVKAFISKFKPAF